MRALKEGIEQRDRHRTTDGRAPRTASPHLRSSALNEHWFATAAATGNINIAVTDPSKAKEEKSRGSCVRFTVALRFQLPRYLSISRGAHELFGAEDR